MSEFLRISKEELKAKAAAGFSAKEKEKLRQENDIVIAENAAAHKVLHGKLYYEYWHDKLRELALHLYQDAEGKWHGMAFYENNRFDPEGEKEARYLQLVNGPFEVSGDTPQERAASVVEELKKLLPPDKSGPKTALALAEEALKRQIEACFSISPGELPAAQEALTISPHPIVSSAVLKAPAGSSVKSAEDRLELSNIQPESSAIPVTVDGNTLSYKKKIGEKGREVEVESKVTVIPQQDGSLLLTACSGKYNDMLHGVATIAKGDDEEKIAKILAKELVGHQRLVTNLGKKTGEGKTITASVPPVLRLAKEIRQIQVKHIASQEKKSLASGVPTKDKRPKLATTADGASLTKFLKQKNIRSKKGSKVKPKVPVAIEIQGASDKWFAAEVQEKDSVEDTKAKKLEVNFFESPDAIAIRNAMEDLIISGCKQITIHDDGSALDKILAYRVALELYKEHKDTDKDVKAPRVDFTLSSADKEVPEVVEALKQVEELEKILTVAEKRLGPGA